MNAPPAAAIAPLKARLAQLRQEREALIADQLHAGAIDRAIQETEALIKQLESPHAPRHP